MDRTVLVKGAGKGIDQSLAHHVARKGGRIITRSSLSGSIGKLGQVNGGRV